MKPTVQAKEWSELNKFLEDMNPEAAREMGRVDVKIIALKSFISPTLAEARKETIQEIKKAIVSHYGEWYDPVIKSDLLPFLEFLKDTL
jgi:hypothetical protein